MKHISSIFAAGALLASFGAAAAQTDPAAGESMSQDQQIQELFQTLDKNQDGALDATEAQAEKGLKNAFPRLASDGKVSKERFVKWYKAYDQPPAQE